MWKTMDEATLKSKKVAELKEIAKTFGLKGYQKMKKAELVAALMIDEEKPAEKPAAKPEEKAEQPAEKPKPAKQQKQAGPALPPIVQSFAKCELRITQVKTC